MKKSHWMSLLVLLVLTIGSAQAKASLDHPISVFDATVSRIKDGDTVDVRDASGKFHCIRIAEIDAPESKQRGGADSTAYLNKLLASGKVTVTYYKTDHKLCKYGPRKIAALTASGVSIAAAMVGAGHAWHNTAFQREWGAAWAARLDALQLEAKRDRRGLWADSNPVAPWDFRHQKGAGDSN